MGDGTVRKVSEDIEDQFPTFGRHSEVQSNLVGGNHETQRNRNMRHISLSADKLHNELKFDERQTMY